ncbi:hypothetical protein GCM10009593_44190 [Microlunatus antarcticus]
MLSDPLRITHVVTNANFAGTERYVVDVSNELAARGHDVLVVGGDPVVVPRELAGPRWSPGATTWEALRELRRSGRRDVVHSHIARSDFVALAADPWTRARRISTRHITAPRGYRAPVRLLGRGVRRLLHREIAVSAWTSAQLDRPADAVLINGVPPAAAGALPRERVVLMAQRLAPEKDTSTGLRAWAASDLRDQGWRLVIAGSGELEDALAKEVAALGITDSVDMTGWVGDLDVRLRTCGLFLAPAPSEPCGLTLLEAMARATPVVAAGAGGHRETIGSLADAALFPPGDAARAAELLNDLGASEPTRNAYGAALRRLQQEKFTISTHVDGLLAVYRS